MFFLWKRVSQRYEVWAYAFSIISKDSKEEVEEVPVEVADMLGEFSNIVSNKVPDGFGFRSQFYKQGSA